MMLFWFFAAVLTLIALLIVLPPLFGRGRESGLARSEVIRTLYQDKLAELEQDLKNDVITSEQYENARRDLQRSLLAELNEEQTPQAAVHTASKSTWLIGLIALGLPLLTTGLYIKFNTGFESLSMDPAKLAAQQQQQQQQQQQPSQQQPTSSMEQAITSIKARLKENPGDLEGWSILGHAYASLQRFEDASQAYERANSLSNFSNPKLLVSQAETMALSQGRVISDKGVELINKALSIQSDNPFGLWLAGWAAYQRESYPNAVQYWERLLPVASKVSPELGKQLPQYIADAKQRAGINTVEPMLPQTQKPQVAEAQTAAGPTVSAAVTLNPELAAKASPEDTLFIYARAAQGPRMPLSLARHQVKDLPVEVTLDDSMSMMPAMKLSNFPKVVIIARVSKSGNAMPQTGDLIGSSETVTTASNPKVSITIDGVVP